MRYLHCGSGPALLLIHGLLGYSFSWRKNLAELGRVATAYAPDLLGAGCSERVAGLDCSMAAAARRMFTFLAVAGVTSVDVLGTSHGGGLAIKMAAIAARERPRLIRKLILSDPVNPWSAHGRLVTRLIATFWGGALISTLGPRFRPLHNFFLNRVYGDVGRIEPGTLEGYTVPLAIPGTMDYLLSIMRCWHSDLASIPADLEKISDLPTLILWGSLDRAVYPASAEPLRQKLRNSKLVIFEGAGHLPYEEVPEEFNRVVIEFLTS